MRIVLDVRPETHRMLERLASLAVERTKQPAALEDCAAVALEVGLRSMAHELAQKDDDQSRSVARAMLGI
jgi:hypothetical protein